MELHVFSVSSIIMLLSLYKQVVISITICLAIIIYSKKLSGTALLSREISSSQPDATPRQWRPVPSAAAYLSKVTDDSIVHNFSSGEFVAILESFCASSDGRIYGNELSILSPLFDTATEESAYMFLASDASAAAPGLLPPQHSRAGGRLSKAQRKQLKSQHKECTGELINFKFKGASSSATVNQSITEVTGSNHSFPSRGIVFIKVDFSGEYVELLSSLDRCNSLLCVFKRLL